MPATADNYHDQLRIVVTLRPRATNQKSTQSKQVSPKNTMKFKYITKLEKFKKFFGMIAQIKNAEGDILDSIDITKTNKKILRFKFDKQEALGEDKKTKVSIVFNDTNGEEKNFQKNGRTFFNLDPDPQTFNSVIRSKYNKKTQLITLEGDRIDTQPPVFTSGDAVSVDENISAGSAIYLATATDKSGPIDFTISGPDASAFSIETVTNFSARISINASPDFEAKPSYSFDVKATDAKGNSSSQPVAVTINDIPDTGDTITLSNFQDFYDASTGFILVNGTQSLRNEHFTDFDDIVNGAAGTLGVGNQQDSLTDPSTSDNDTFNLATNVNNDLKTSLAAGNLTNLTNVENLIVTATNDNSDDVNFSQVTGLKTLELNGLFQQNVIIRNYIDTAQINNFNFSGSTNNAIGFVVQNANNATATTTNEPLNFVGSPGVDTFEASIGAATILGGDGNDNLKGSISNSTYIQGQTGTDTIELIATNMSTDVVSYQDIKLTNDANNVTNFVAFLDSVNNPNNNRHDKLEFDADTVTNFNAGVTVEQKTFAELQPLLGTPAADNNMLVQADPQNENLSLHGKSWIALDNTDGLLYYSQDGNFAVNAQTIGQITFLNNNDATEFLSTENVTIIA